MTVYLSLGSNIHPRHRYIDEACRLLSERCGTILRRSEDYYSMPVGYESDNEYLNICVALQTDLEPLELLYATQQIERDLGRTQKSTIHYQLPTPSLSSSLPFRRGSRKGSFNYSDRTIDIDLLCAKDEKGQPITLHTAELLLPHPRMSERAFVTVPLSQISPL